MRKSSSILKQTAESIAVSNGFSCLRARTIALNGKEDNYFSEYYKAPAIADYIGVYRGDRGGRAADSFTVAVEKVRHTTEDDGQGFRQLLLLFAAEALKDQGK